uniref:senescence-associated carboxylesterase 101-like n=1 Tax=Erigeron canadensis TaxID=72917 RepID=UPI001CB8B9EE|nr:senescence-associated carboxylesterase 101-like [Erigeron canadensis]XP_043617682.1 senescence-associated carboxylesterase 101-like [Erigeron canadensis]
MNQDMFSSELENGNFLGSIDLLENAYNVLLKTSPLAYKLDTSNSRFQVLAFNYSLDDITRFHHGEFDVVSSENVKLVEFISTKVNPKFCINKAAVDLFGHHLSMGVDQENELIKKRLVVTGQSVGGYVAILFTLWLHHIIDKNESNGSFESKRPICITFGSPLVGDEALQQAIFERPKWKSSFLNVVAKTDVVPCLFTSSGVYKPFGTYLFCTQVGGHTSFEDDDSILAILEDMASSLSTENFQAHDYKSDLVLIKEKVLYRGVSDIGEFGLNSLKAGITLQLMEVGLVDTQSNNRNILIEKIEAKQVRIIHKRRNVYEPSRKLNDMKISMVQMEIYKMSSRPTMGYYDSYKNPRSKDEIERQQNILKHQRKLYQYWKKLVEETERMPQEAGAVLRKRWLYGGITYTRLAEPLDIAEYYKKGNVNYLENRSNHYTLLEKWSTKDKEDLSPTPRTNKAASLTEDSCFWAHVEEALISMRKLKNGSSISIEVDVKKLEGFEAYVLSRIRNYSVSSDIFLEESSLMKWWSEYKEYKGPSYASQFALYMNNREYRSYY